MSQKIEKTPRHEPDISRIRFLILDVDGVMTDGCVTYTSSGEELKSFNIKDGAGIKYWLRSGHGAGIITGRTSEIVKRRASELGIEFVEMDAKAKLPAFERMIEAAGVTMDEVAMIGDDLLDLPIIRRVGLGIAVADAVAELREAAHWTTTLPGGHGAIREAIERILKAQRRWDAIMERYLI